MRETREGEVVVLHVDDEPSLAEMAATYLERAREGFTVETATGVDEGLSVLEERDVDCVVSDYDMPGRDGLEFLRVVRERYGDLPFVLYTGKGSEEIASEAISAGVDDYLQKETGTDQYALLAKRVENLVSGRRASDAAARSDERYHNLVDTAPTAIALFDRDGELVYANDAGAEMLGYEDPGVMKGMAMPSFVHPDDREEAVTRFERLQAEGEAAPETGMRLLTADGEVRHVRIASAPGVYRGEPVAQAALKDVTPPREAGGEEGSLLQRAVDTLDDVFYVLDDEGSLVLWNDRVNEVSGLDDEALAGADPVQFVAEEDAASVRASLEGVLSTGHGVIQAAVRTGDGGTVPFEFRGHRLTDDDGDVVGMAGIGRDVSDRRRRERALRALNDFAADISGYTDPVRVCERTVAAAEAVLEFDLSVVNLEEDGRLPITATTSEVPPDGATEMSVEQGLAGRTYREGRSFVVDDVQDHPDADPQGPYRAAVSVPVGDHGVLQAVDEEPGAFDGTDRELAELLAAHCAGALDRIEQQAALERQNERLDEFASLVSHDLRNPLTLLQTSVDLARETGDDEHLDDCEAAVQQMDALIDDLLTLAREGEVVDTVDEVDVDEVARTCWENVATEGASLSVAEGVTVAADPDRLRQALANLLGNAVEHGGPEVSVRVGALSDGRGFYVADDGPGVPEEVAGRVFEPGFTTSEDGTGFGLRIVEAVVEAHGWAVSVTDSEAGGARFDVRVDG